MGGKLLNIAEEFLIDSGCLLFVFNIQNFELGTAAMQFFTATGVTGIIAIRFYKNLVELREKKKQRENKE